MGWNNAFVQTDGTGIETQEIGHRCVIQVRCPMAILVGDYVLSRWCLVPLTSCRDTGLQAHVPIHVQGRSLVRQ